MSAYTWEELRGLSAPRQLPRLDEVPEGAEGVAALLGRVGPMQTQTARSAFLGLAARAPGITHEQISAAYERFAVVRGSSIRGTVHTSTPDDHALTEVATRLGQRALWQRSLTPERLSIEQIWAALEAFAWDEWHPPARLHEGLVQVLAAADGEASASRARALASRSFAFGHGGLIRRPLGDGGWDRQTAPGYRTAAALLGERGDILADPESAINALVRRHLASHGPASRQDLAWWSGVGLRIIDAALARLSGELSAREGPDGRIYHDLAAGTPEPAEVPGIRLLPEFDATMCAYDPAGRDRFVPPRHGAVLWDSKNGQVLPPVLRDGRVVGCWRMTGSAARRPLQVSMLTGERAPARRLFDEPIHAVEQALGITVSDLRIGKHGPVTGRGVRG